MKKAILTLGVLLVTVSASAGRLERRESYSFPAEGVERIQLSHPVGSLEIVGYNGSEVRVEMEVRCGAFRFRCGDKAEEIELDQRLRGDTLRLEIDGYPRNSSGISVDLRIEVPRNTAIVIEKGVGNTIVRNCDGSLQIEAGVGNLEIYMDERDVRSVHAETGVGGAKLYVDGKRTGESDGFLFLGNEIEWQGNGDSRLETELGVGSLRIELD